LLIPDPKPFDHVIVPSAHPLAVNVTLSFPQTKPPPLKDGATGLKPSVIITVLDTEEGPQVFSHLAVYDPRPTFTVEVVSPLLHFKVEPEAHEELKATLAAPQTVPEPVIVGAVGKFPVFIVTEFELGETPQIFSQYAK
jgi:hypothetical protein